MISTRCCITVVALALLPGTEPPAVRAQGDVVETASPITALLLGPRQVIGASQAGLTVVDWPDLSDPQLFPPLAGISHIHHLLSTPDAEAVIAVGGTPYSRGELRWLDPSDFREARRITLGEDVLYDACWMPASNEGDALRLAVAGPAEQVHVVNVASGEASQLAGHSRTVLCVEYLGGDRPLLLSAGRDATIRVWDAQTLERIRTLDNHTDAVVDLAARPGDGAGLAMLASAGADRTVRFWQPTIGRLVRFARLESAPLQIAWSPDGQTLWASCRDGRLRSVDVDTVEVRELPTTISQWAYSMAIDGEGARPGEAIVVGGPQGRIERVKIQDPR